MILVSFGSTWGAFGPLPGGSWGRLDVLRRLPKGCFEAPFASWLGSGDASWPLWAPRAPLGPPWGARRAAERVFRKPRKIGFTTHDMKQQGGTPPTSRPWPALRGSLCLHSLHICSVDYDHRILRS